MIRSRTLLATAALLGLSGASALAAPLTVTGQGENFAVAYADDYTGNILGGGTVRTEGNSRNLRIIHDDARFAQRPAGLPVFQGGSEGDVAYLPAPATAGLRAAR
ncbi:hypothetical protein E0493_06825 [Roseomonas sp. M0104]|uniref:Uncharacterized protein n=1 Tax=Teichococcus coralli TaxID=2545983 RepID=A0A845BAF0_9PROT|nr:hypothetical protein [Pseudoroseomonas coralli]MXP63066.1 hypothetical protein [Pseudoroseomonas coralli]